MRTLPIILGSKKAIKLVSFLLLFPIILVLIYINNFLIANALYYATIYILATIIAPLVYVFIKTFTAKSKPDFHQLSIVLKIILFFGIISILIINQNIKLHHV